MSTIKFIKNFLRDPDVASITPTSKRCVRKVCSHIDFDRDLIIVEYGPGDGVFSRYFLERMTEGSKLIMVENNKDFAAHLNESLTDPRARVIHGRAGDIVDHLEPEEVGQVDYVVSGIPFSFLKKDRKIKVLEATQTILKADGRFLAYQTSGHLKKPVMEVFGNYSTEFELLCLPPYFIYEVVNRKEPASAAS
ncbi:MAG: rRNA adenine N-6-methyltransferase family protein [Balneolaceae bacterium]